MPEPMTVKEARQAVVDCFNDSAAVDGNLVSFMRTLDAYDSAIARATLAQRREGVTEAMVESREDFDNALIGYGEQIIRSHYMAYVNRYELTTKEYAEKVMREIIRNVDRFMERERTGLAARAASGEAALGAREGGTA